MPKAKTLQITLSIYLQRSALIQPRTGLGKVLKAVRLEDIDGGTSRTRGTPRRPTGPHGPPVKNCQIDFLHQEVTNFERAVGDFRSTKIKPILNTHHPILIFSF